VANHISPTLLSEGVELVEGLAFLTSHVIVFDEISVALLEAIEEAGSASSRILLVPANQSILTHENSWQFLALGASDIIPWKTNAGCGACVAKLRRWAAVDELIHSPMIRNSLVGTSRQWINFLRQVVEYAVFSNGGILLQGETGTGKELVARLSHTLDTRPNKRELVVVDSTTVVPQLSGSEFFGHQRGAFTGATESRDGAFALADNGTLFLDEVGDLPIALQGELLRVIQEKTYKRVGSNVWKKTDFRLISATHRDLRVAREEGTFRTDLYYRIASHTCSLPALRDRVEDIPLLVEHFMQLRVGSHVECDPMVMKFLVTRSYPGNIRELQQLVERILSRYVGQGPIAIGDIPEEDRPRDAIEIHWVGPEFSDAIRRAVALQIPLKTIGGKAKSLAIRFALDQERGSKQKAAARLAVTDRTIQKRTKLRKRERQDLKKYAVVSSA
jgi:transcriptional regulator with GAF, ATPase, and Fis domain